MKKQILNIGKALSRAEQKLVIGGDVLMNADGGGGASGKCWVTCKDGWTTSVLNCGLSADNVCSMSNSWQWCSCWG